MLSACWGRPVLLDAPELLRSESRSVVLRARVRGGARASVVLKHFGEEAVCALDEGAGLEFLGEAAPGLAPRLVASDAAAARLLLLEDLGRCPTLETLLRSADAQAASGALLALARAVGAMHAATLGRQEAYERVRQALVPRAVRVRLEAARRLLEHEGRVQRWLEAAGAGEPPAGLSEELLALARTLADPGPFLAFTHGDLAPSNVLFTPEGVRLVDLEYAGMRHALHDALMWLLSVPLPEALVARVDAAYRAALAPACPAAADERGWTQARAALVAARCVELLQWIAPAALEREREWAPGLSERGALLQHLGRFRTWVGPSGLYPALQHTFAALEWRLTLRAVPAAFVWPAFR